MNQSKVKALVLAGFGMNCDYETQYSLTLAGAQTDRVHVNRLIEMGRTGPALEDYHILAAGGGFSWADDHGAGVLLGLKLKSHLGREIQDFISAGKLFIGICNGFQALVNMGLLPGFDGDYHARTVALTANDCGNFRNDWIHLAVNRESRCIFTQGLKTIDLPVRHGEGKFYAPPEVITRLNEQGQVALRYAAPDYAPAGGRFPDNPNGSLDDIAGICDETGRVFGLMPHPEAFHHLTNHPNWARELEQKRRHGQTVTDWEGNGVKIFRNAVRYAEAHLR
ncbi:MAG: phosphoribosylformylglycinamidine synthase subunit PurQ [Pseudomonadota bacterium]